MPFKWCIHFYLWIYDSIYLSIDRSVYLSSHLSTYLNVSMYLNLSVFFFLYIYTYVHISINWACIPPYRWILSVISITRVYLLSVCILCKYAYQKNCVCTRVCIYLCTCICICIRMFVHMYENICARMFVHMYEYIRIYHMHFLDKYMFTYKCRDQSDAKSPGGRHYTHTRTLATYTHTYTHTCKQIYDHTHSYTSIGGRVPRW